MKNVGIYVRVSTAEQRDHGMSVESQISALETFCANNGYIVYSIYNDAGLSASKTYKSRPALLQMLDDCKHGKIQLLLFTKLDRFFRSVPDYYSCIEQMNGVPWRAIWEDYETETSSGKFKVNIMLSIAQAESERTSERIKAVNEYRRSIGNYVGGRPPSGYVIKGKKLAIDESMQPIIHKFFDTFLLTFSTSKAMNSVSDQMRMNRQIANKMLRNETYCGNAYGTECPAYITKDDFRKIQNSFRNRRNRENGSRCYIFSGLIKCPVCGSNMCGRMYRRDHYEYKMYHCQSNTSGSGCKNGGNVYEQKLEEFLLSELDKIISDTKLEVEIQMENQKGNLTKIKNLRTRLKRIGDRYELGDFSKEEYLEKRKDIEREIDALEQSTDSSAIPQLPTDWRTIYEELTMENRRAFWRATIKQIDFTGTGKKKEFRIMF